MRISISQMDVPTRQVIYDAVVAPDERSAAAGVTRHRPLDRCGDLADADGHLPALRR